MVMGSSMAESEEGGRMAAFLRLSGLGQFASIGAA
jgi:hypothetical protein